MGLEPQKDYVFAPHVDVILDKACFVGTKTHLVLVPDEKERLPTSFGEFVRGALSKTSTVESIDLGGRPPREAIGALLESPGLTLEALSSFFEGLKASWDAVQVVSLAGVSKLKVRAGMCGGSITFKKHGDLGYTAMVTNMPKAKALEVKAFYEELMAQVNA
jgi:hypothetical protein